MVSNLNLLPASRVQVGERSYLRLSASLQADNLQRPASSTYNNSDTEPLPENAGCWMACTEKAGQVEILETNCFLCNHLNSSGNDHIMNLAKISDSKNSIWAARPINELKFLPYEVVSKFTSHLINNRCSEVGARIWSKQLFNISRKTLPFFE